MVLVWHVGELKEPVSVHTHTHKMWHRYLGATRKHAHASMHAHTQARTRKHSHTHAPAPRYIRLLLGTCTPHPPPLDTPPRTCMHAPPPPRYKRRLLDSAGRLTRRRVQELQELASVTAKQHLATNRFAQQVGVLSHP